MQDRQQDAPERSGFAMGALQRRLLLAAALLLPLGAAVWKLAQDERQPAPAAAVQPAPPQARLADFQGEQPSADARVLANWVATTHDNGKDAFFVVDKKDARVYVFTPDARLKASTPVLLGQARGDEILPGAAEKEPAQMRPEEKTTPAGRYVAQPGVNASNEDVIWVDYDAAISMHRIRPSVPAERRPQRLATQTEDDNRISFGCINLPVAFYEQVARPTVTQYGAVIYVLPEVKTLQEVFGAYDVTDPAQVAAARLATLTQTAARSGNGTAGSQG